MGCVVVCVATLFGGRMPKDTSRLPASFFTQEGVTVVHRTTASPQGTLEAVSF